jgi:hypothetical protein
MAAFAWLPLVYAHALLFMVLLLFPSSSLAENYIAGQIGVSLPGSLSNVNRVSPLVRAPDSDLMTSFLYGGKLGHYFDQMRWFGVEAELFRSNPNISQNGAEPISRRTSATLCRSRSGDLLWPRKIRFTAKQSR